MNTIPDVNRKEWRDFLSGTLQVDLDTFLMKTMLYQAKEQLKEGVSIDVIVADAHAKCTRFYTVEGVVDDIAKVFEKKEKSPFQERIVLNFEVGALSQMPNEEDDLFDKNIFEEPEEPLLEESEPVLESSNELVFENKQIQEEDAIALDAMPLGVENQETDKAIDKTAKISRIEEIVDKAAKERKAIEEKIKKQKQEELQEQLNSTALDETKMLEKKVKTNKDVVVKQSKEKKETYAFVDPLDRKKGKDNKKNSFFDKISNIFYTDE